MDIRKIFFNIPEAYNTPILVVSHHDYMLWRHSSRPQFRETLLKGNWPYFGRI